MKISGSDPALAPNSYSRDLCDFLAIQILSPDALYQASTDWSFCVRDGLTLAESHMLFLELGCGCF